MSSRLQVSDCPSFDLRKLKIPAAYSSRNSGNRCWLAVTYLVVAAIGALGSAAQTVSPSGDPVAASAEIVQKIVKQNEIRAEHLKYCASRRHYHVEYHGFARSMDANMDVEATYSAVSGKAFRVVDESGSHILIDHVLKKLLDAERDDSRNHDAALTPLNYKFNLVGSATENGRSLYVLEVEPRVVKKLLYRGRIWVDAEDYAVVRVEAQPAENPSFWIKNTNIRQVYSKTGEFWLPEQNRSETKVRLGGTAILTIDYGRYQFEPPGSGPLQSGGVTATE